MLLEAIIIKKETLPISLDSSKSKEVEKPDKDFHSILEGIEEKKGVEGKYHNKFKEQSINKERNEDVDYYNELLDQVLNQFSYLIELIVENKSKIENFNVFDFDNTLDKLKGLYEILNQISSNSQPLDFNVKDLQLIKDLIGQAVEVIDRESKQSQAFTLEFTSLMKEIEKKVNDNPKLKTNNNNIEEESKIQEKLIAKEDNKLKYEDLTIEKNQSKDDKPIEISVDFTSDTSKKSDSLQTAPHTAYDLNIFTNKTITGDSRRQINFVQEFNKEELIEQLVEKVQIREGIDKQEVKVKLKPDYLGDLILKLESKAGSIEAKIFVDNYRTKEIIEAGLFQLKEEFKENGIEIKTIEVFIGTGEDFEKEERNRYSFKKKNRVKLKIVEKIGEEIKIYDNNFINQKSGFYDGKLNLFV